MLGFSFVYFFLMVSAVLITYAIISYTWPRQPENAAEPDPERPWPAPSVAPTRPPNDGAAVAVLSAVRSILDQQIESIES